MKTEPGSISAGNRRFRLRTDELSALDAAAVRADIVVNAANAEQEPVAHPLLNALHDFGKIFIQTTDHQPQC